MSRRRNGCAGASVYPHCSNARCNSSRTIRSSGFFHSQAHAGDHRFRHSNGTWSIFNRSRRKESLPVWYGHLGQSAFEDLSLRRAQNLRQDEDWRLHVRAGYHCTRYARAQKWEASRIIFALFETGIGATDTDTSMHSHGERANPNYAHHALWVGTLHCLTGSLLVTFLKSVI